jgi:hypothetical protein
VVLGAAGSTPGPSADHHLPMTSRLLAAALGVVAGLLLVVAGGLPFLQHGSHDWEGLLADAGYAAALAAVCATGYRTVARAPVWLRIIVSIAFPLLVASVWEVVDQAVGDNLDGWKGPAGVHLLAGVLLLAVGLLGLRRPAVEDGGDYSPTHHR